MTLLAASADRFAFDPGALESIVSQVTPLLTCIPPAIFACCHCRNVFQAGHSGLNHSSTTVFAFVESECALPLGVGQRKIRRRAAKRRQIKRVEMQWLQVKQRW
jgi:hypothetical protein